MQGKRRRLETRKGVIVSKVEERGERKEWGASEMNGGDMGGAKGKGMFFCRFLWWSQ